MRRKSQRTLSRDGNICRHYGGKSGVFLLTLREVLKLYGINIFTLMPPSADAKRQALQDTGTFNPRSDQVHHPLFADSEFFDPRDLLQLKYETLRALEVDGYAIAKAATDFGLSRPTIYQAQEQFQQQGLQGLLPHKRGPKSPHKLTEEVWLFLQELQTTEPDLNAPELVRRVRQRFRVKLHPRTIEKAFKSKAKRGLKKSS